MGSLTNEKIELLKQALPKELDGKFEKHLNLMSYKILKNNSSIRTDKYMFGCALKYILLAQQGIKGQGDKDEGLLARLDKRKKHYPEKINLYIRTFGIENLCIRETEYFSDIWRKQVLSIPFGCFFSFEKDITSLIPPAGSGKKEIVVDYNLSGALFTDFYSSDVDSVNIGEFCIINYLSERYLYECIVQALSHYGVSHKHISIKSISYTREPDKEWECPELYHGGSNTVAPELFYKDISFSHQSEKRIAVIDDSFSFHFHQPFNKQKNVFQRNIFEIYDRLIDVLEQDMCNIIEPNSIITKKDGIAVKITIPLLEV